MSSANNSYKSQSVHQLTDDGMNVDQLFEQVKNKNHDGLTNEYEDIRKLPKAICRNYVDGYEQKTAYICLEVPIISDDLVKAFWSMVWHENSAVIVLLDNIEKSKSNEFTQYWPLKTEEIKELELFNIENVKTKLNDSCMISELKITHQKSSKTRNIIHCQFKAWNDSEIFTRSDFTRLFEFRKAVRKNKKELLKKLNKNSKNKLNSPLIVQCLNPNNRTGRYCTLDISINCLLKTKIVNIKDIVEKIRSQYASSICTHDHYLFCYIALCEYAIYKGCVTSDKKKIIDALVPVKNVLLSNEQLSKTSIDEIPKESNIVSNSQNLHNDKNLKKDELTDGSMDIDQLVEHIKTQNIHGLHNEFGGIKQFPDLSFKAFNANKAKNRYPDVRCLDDTRVKLKDLEKGSVIIKSIGSDYIHANYVDGYKQKNAYIGTQGPLNETIEDFWHMIWQENTVVIVMLTNVIENNTPKCAQYWPLEKNEKMKLKYETSKNEKEILFEIENVKTDKKDDYVITELEITNKKTNEKRFIKHCHFVSWPDHGVPDNPSGMLGFVSEVRRIQASLVQELTNNKKWSGHRLGPPIVVHCSAGIGRTGTFFTIDITINRLLDVKVNIKDTVTKIRSQRASSVQTKEQYVFCYKAIVEYLIEKRLIENDKFKYCVKNRILNDLFSTD